MRIVKPGDDCHQPIRITPFLFSRLKIGIMPNGRKKSSVYTVHNNIRMVKGGSEYFTLLKEQINKAHHSIYIRIYIWAEDTTGSMVADELIKAAKRNVKVYVVADGYASQNLSRSFVNNLKENGIHFRYFEPLLRSSHFYFGRRMHEKIIVIDGRHALVGGINFGQRYNDVHGKPAWLDYALHVEGEAAYKLYEYCLADWEKNVVLPPFSAINIKHSQCSVRISRNDWVKGKHEIWRTYFNWFNQAEKSITIMCSYFLPGRVLRHRLARAARRGVKVRLILAGPSDIMLAKHAERYLYGWMLKNGIEIYEYQPSVLHVKMMVVDEHWVTIGSFNVNNVSAYASMELNLDVRNKSFALSTQKLMNSIIANSCVQVTEKNFITNATFFKRFMQKTSYEIVRVILNLSTFYFKRE